MLKRIIFARNLIFIGFMLVFHTVETKAAWGDFDTSFGFQGVTVDPINGYLPQDVAIQPDGKILVTGERVTIFGGTGFFLRRYLSNGQLDTTFGSNGAAISPELNFGNSDYRGLRIVVQANGKIAVAGWANSYYAVWQFNATGRNDAAFGQNGLQILTKYPQGYLDLNIQSGKLLLSLGKLSGNYSRLVLIRLNANGTIDNTFGTFGESLTNLLGSGFGTVIENTSRKITVSGVKFDDLSAKGLERKLANGQDDLTFSPAPIFSFGIIGTGLVKMANGK